MMKHIELTGGHVAFVDDDDYEWLYKFNWLAHKSRDTFYAARYPWRNKVREKLVYMHRAVSAATAGQIVDHANRCTLDNRKSNLRFVTPSQNCTNRRVRRTNKLGVKGVRYIPRLRKYEVQLVSDGITYSTTSVSLDLAMKIREAVGRTLFGDYDGELRRPAPCR